MSDPTQSSPAAGRTGPARGTRRAVGGVPARTPAPDGDRDPCPARGTGAQPVPETPEEVDDGSQQERWLRSQRPPHWG